MPSGSVILWLSFCRDFTNGLLLFLIFLRKRLLIHIKNNEESTWRDPEIIRTTVVEKVG